MTKLTFHLVLVHALALSACVGLPPDAAVHPSAEPIVAAERAFAADTAEMGFATGFRKWSSPEAVGYQPDLVNIHTSLEGQKPGPDDPTIEWWPEWAGIAASGELGFTTGPSVIGGTRYGHYFTVWKKQANGDWRWIFDGGARNKERSSHGPSDPVNYLAPATARAGGAAKAWSEIGAVEATFATSAATDTIAAYTKLLADDVHIQGGGTQNQPAVGKAAAIEELKARGIARMDASQTGGEASLAGDLAYTRGDVSDVRDGKERHDHYVRIWQKRAEGWRLVFDQIFVSR
jgi:ketosteroid isomerase-like protein